METQNLMVLAHLKTGRELTPIEALKKYGCFRLAARVYELKQAGWPIYCERRPIDNRRTIGVYSLSLNKDEWPNEL